MVHTTPFGVDVWTKSQTGRLLSVEMISLTLLERPQRKLQVESENGSVLDQNKTPYP